MLNGKKFSQDLQEIRQVLEEHLNAINENTAEVQALFDYLQEMDVKIEKVSQRLDQLQLSQDQVVQKPAVTPLNQTEKKVFLILYTESSALSYQEIAQKTKIPVSIIPECVSSLAHKGVPIVRSFCKEQLFVKIDPVFKEMQAKENIINLSLQSFME